MSSRRPTDFPLLRRSAFKRALSAIAGTAALVTINAHAVPITINTSSITAGTDAVLAVDLLDGDLLGNNTARISNLHTDGTDVLTTCDSSLGCNDLPPFELNDSNLLGELLINLKLGTFISFDLSITNAFNNVVDAASDLLIVHLLDSTSFSLFNTDLNDPNGAVPYANAVAVASLASGQIFGATGVTTVPEPASLLLLASGAAWLQRRKTAPSTQS